MIFNKQRLRQLHIIYVQHINTATVSDTDENKIQIKIKSESYFKMA